jgi:hypothetical protein
MKPRFFVSLFAYLSTLAMACLDPDPCAGSRASQFQECLARGVGDLAADTDTDADSDADSDTDADTDTNSGGTDPPDTGEPIDTGTCLDPAVDNDGDGQSEQAGDCNDADDQIYFGAIEICDPADVDEDCDGDADDLDVNVPVKSLWLEDADTDTFGNEFVDTRTCDNPPANFILADADGDGDEYNDPRDCDDTQPNIYPGAPLGLCDSGDTGAPTDFDSDGTSDCP